MIFWKTRKITCTNPGDGYVRINAIGALCRTFKNTFFWAIFEEANKCVNQYTTFGRYAWTIANCATCETHMGWLFTATNRKLKPRSFWGIRSCQVAEEMR